MLSRVGDHILQDIYTLNMTWFWTNKIVAHPKQKPWRGGGLKQINSCRKPFAFAFKMKKIYETVQHAVTIMIGKRCYVTVIIAQYSNISEQGHDVHGNPFLVS